jgi:hypothetical protein
MDEVVKNNYGKTKVELEAQKKRAFQVYCSDPGISKIKLSKEVGVKDATITKWMDSQEWVEWANKFFGVANERLKQRIISLDDKIVNYIDDLITGRLEKEQLRASTAVVNVYKTRLEMAGLVNKKADTINNNSYIDNREVKTVHIDNMSENQVLKFVTSGEVPSDLDKIENAANQVIIENEENNSSINSIGSSINLEELGIKTI